MIIHENIENLRTFMKINKHQWKQWRPQDPPGRSQDAPKTRPGRLQDGPRRPQDAPRRFQDAPKTPFRVHSFRVRVSIRFPKAMRRVPVVLVNCIAPGCLLPELWLMAAFTQKQMVFQWFSAFHVFVISFSRRNAFVWKSKKIHENHWKSMKIHENPWKSLTLHENQWKSMKIHENPWKSMKLCENQWKST